MAPAIPFMIGAGVVTSALGTYQAGQAAAAEAESQKAVAEYNARVAQQEAKAQQARAEYESRRQAEAAERYAASLRAGLGASGVVTSVGTPLMIQARQAAESELENLMIGYEGRVAAGRARSQAAIQRAQAGIYGQRAGYATTGAFVGAGARLLSGFGELGYRYYGP